MANLVALQQFGCLFGIADQVFVVRECDITKEFLRKILTMMYEVNTSSSDEFFKKKKVCFLSTQTIYNKFLAALAKEAKSL